MHSTDQTNADPTPFIEVKKSPPKTVMLLKAGLQQRQARAIAYDNKMKNRKAMNANKKAKARARSKAARSQRKAK
jgi:hypothetical protein